MFGSSRNRYRFYPGERGTGARILGFVKVLLILFLLYEIVSTFLLTTYVVESRSMAPGLEPGDRVVVSPLPVGAHMPLFNARAPALGELRRGDLVVVRAPYAQDTSRLLQPVRSAVRFFTGRRGGQRAEDWRPEVSLRRIVGLPGDAVRMEDFIFYLRPAAATTFRSEFEAAGIRYPLRRNDAPASWEEALPFSAAMEATAVPEDSYFLATDNRTAGLDSRHRGAVPAEAVRARVVLRYWPLSRFGRP